MPVTIHLDLFRMKTALRCERAVFVFYMYPFVHYCKRRNIKNS